MSTLPINSPIKGPGLTKPGVVILQFLVIFLFEGIEILFRNSLGIITCLAIWIAFLAQFTWEEAELHMSQPLHRPFHF